MYLPIHQGQVSEFPPDSGYSESDWHVLAGFWHPVAVSSEVRDKPVAARLLGVDKERVAIRPKMAADLIATTGNPLVDIHALKRVSFVMKDGRIVRR